ncbi:MAG: DEAD/DEAH box helicase family protein [Sphaerochaetaceae bacterium]|nr:DEAD/DEAH box helicase family protein [Sphaerochaetaceae bacterium]
MTENDYQTFLKNKIRLSEEAGITCDPREINPLLKPHQKDIVKWAVEGGRRAVFCAFGLGKTMMQLEILRLILVKTGGGRGLIIIPLGVKQEFQRDAEKLGIKVSFIRSDTEALWNGIYITNYESVREGKLDPQRFKVVSLDEAGILRGFGGTKTFREFMATIAGDDRRDRSNPINTGGVPYRFVATATPSPNEYIELLAYAAMLGIMDVSQAKTRFFKRDSTKADHLTIHPHKEKEFWLWVASWAIFLQSPKDICTCNCHKGENNA